MHCAPRAIAWDMCQLRADTALRKPIVLQKCCRKWQSLPKVTPAALHSAGRMTATRGSTRQVRMFIVSQLLCDSQIFGLCAATTEMQVCSIPCMRS